MRQHRTKKQRLQFEQLEVREFLDASGILLPGAASPDEPVEYRTIDGSDNNLTSLTQGAADTNVIRFGYPAIFPDGHGDQIDPAGRPNARDISNRINAQSESVVNDRYLTDWIVQWGQFLTHDMDLTGTDAANNVLSDGSVGDFSIAINDPQDPLGPNPIPFNRSNFDPTTGTPDLLPTPFPPFQRPNWREQVNEVTSYIDASNVYGSDDSRAAALRTFEDGKLVTAANGALPGYNTSGEENDDPFGLGADLFLAGDVRANEQVGLTAVHALFVREHNRLADLLKAYDSSLTDEQIYQTARKIVGAEMQIITYKEFLPALMGDAAPQALDYQYNDSLDASITNSFAAAIFRYGHSMQSSELLLVNNKGKEVDSLTLRDAFFDPDILGDNPKNVDLLMKGLASQLAQENDLLLIDDIRNFLFGPPGAGGSDLAALDIQRGRDHGLPDYNALRFFYGLQPVASFSEISSDPAIQAALEELYGTVGNIDAFIGVLAEDHLPGSSLGELTSQIINNQFTRLRDGDRLFYTDDPGLQTHAVQAVIDLEKVTLANIIRDNTSIQKIQDNVFFDKSVLFYRAPEARYANIWVIVDKNRIILYDKFERSILETRRMDQTSQIMLMGTESYRDFFTILNGRWHDNLPGGIVVHGGGYGKDAVIWRGTGSPDQFVVDTNTVWHNGDVTEFYGIKDFRIYGGKGLDDIVIIGEPDARYVTIPEKGNRIYDATDGIPDDVPRWFIEDFWWLYGEDDDED